MFTYPFEEQSYLKMLEPDDASELFLLTWNSMDRLKKWLPLIGSNRRQEDTEAFIKSSLLQLSENNGFQAGIWHQDKIAGVIGFHYVNWYNRTTSIGYWIGDGFEGKGLITKACRAMIQQAFDTWQLTRVEIRAAEENVKSRSIPEKLGFTQEGKIRQAELLQGEYVDHIVYGLLAEEWKKQQSQNN
ncbi:GNAT family N-acetyltransferase [Sediminibacillus halophilus]|uniref:Ribosomal-protein-serine acetyltransferase n=1 Tax=Sediminibacillus halophilus TaxID=482461 RepID=A0A1G9P1N3_9BACI|nr:GNAT family protein [Sediminibacillus halophilus]SDL92483.1 ribosomal-protein-serine acetyltransferase [Sediminibacillus halophilus]